MDGSIGMSESAETKEFSRLESRVFEALVGEITRLAFAVTAGQITRVNFLLELENRVALLWSLRHNLRVRTALAKAETLMNADAVLASSRKMAELAELMAGLHADEEQERREKEEARKREERTPNSNSNSKEVQAHSQEGLENTKCLESPSNSNSKPDASTPHCQEPSASSGPC